MMCSIDLFWFGWGGYHVGQRDVDSFYRTTWQVDFHLSLHLIRVEPIKLSVHAGAALIFCFTKSNQQEKEQNYGITRLNSRRS
jgi:hypothetical protein